MSSIQESTLFYRAPQHLISLISKASSADARSNGVSFGDYAYRSQVIGWVNTSLSWGSRSVEWLSARWEPDWAWGFPGRGPQYIN